MPTRLGAAGNCQARWHPYESDPRLFLPYHHQNGKVKLKSHIQIIMRIWTNERARKGHIHNMLQSTHGFMFLNDFPGFGGGETLMIRMAEWCTKNAIPSFWLGTINPEDDRFERGMRQAGTREIIMLPRRRGDMMIDYVSRADFQFDGIERLTVVCVGNLETVFAAESLKPRYPHITFDIFYYAVAISNIGWPDRAARFLIPLRRMVKPRGVIQEMFARNMVVYMNDGLLTHDRKVRPDVDFPAQMPILRLPVPVHKEKLDRDVILNRARQGEKTVLTCARLQFPFKGYILDLVDVFAQLSEKYPNVKLKIIGDGDGRDALKARIQKQREEVQKKIEWIPGVPYSELQRHLESAYVYVGMGTTLLDACNSGVPSISANCEQEVCETSGFFFEDWDGLGRIGRGDPVLPYLEKILSIPPEEYYNWTEQCHELFKTYYGMDGLMEQWLQLENTDKGIWISGRQIARYRSLARCCYGVYDLLRILKKKVLRHL